MPKPIEKTSIPPDEVVKAPEVRGLRTMFTDIDGEVGRRLAEKYSNAVPPERLRKLTSIP